jgi:hypothetical protein
MIKIQLGQAAAKCCVHAQHCRADAQIAVARVYRDMRDNWRL